MLQVLLVRHSFGEGLAWRKSLYDVFFMDFKHFVNIYLTRLGILNRQL